MKNFSIILYFVLTFTLTLCLSQSQDLNYDFVGSYDLSEFEKDKDGVLILNEENFDKAVAAYDYLLVHFYKDYCDGCDVFAADFARVSKSLTFNESHVHCAKLDLTDLEDFYSNYNIPQELPHVKFYREGEPNDYTGGPLFEDVLRWLDRKAYSPFHEVDDLDIAKSLIKEFSVVIFAFFNDLDSDEADVFSKVADDMFEYQFLATTEPKIMEFYNVKPGTVLMFKHDKNEKLLKYTGEFNYKDLKKWVAIHAIPLIPELSDEESVKVIFGSEYDNFLWLILSKSKGHFEKYLPAAREVAKDYREQVMFVVVNADNEDKLNILELLRIDRQEIPLIRIVRLAAGVEKFTPPTNEINEENIRKFVSDYMKESGYLYTYGDEPIKGWNEKLVKELVTSTFDEFVRNPSRNVLVEFYSPGCGMCKRVEPIYETVAKIYEHAPNIELARINMDKNEVNGVAVMVYPTFKFFNTTNHMIDFNLEPTVKNFEKFIDNHSVGCKSCWRKNQAHLENELRDEL